MSNEEKILSILERMQTDISDLKTGQNELIVRTTRLEGRVENLEGRMEDLEGRMEDLAGRQTALEANQETLTATVKQIDQRLRRVEVVQENRVLTGIDLLSEGMTALAETTVRKEDFEALREDLGLQKFRIDVITDKLRQG